MTDPRPVAAAIHPADIPDDREIRVLLAKDFASTCWHKLGLRGKETVEWDEEAVTLTWDLGGGLRGYQTLLGVAKRMDSIGGFMDPMPWGLKITYDDLGDDLGIRGYTVSGEVQIQNREKVPLSLEREAETGEWPSKLMSTEPEAWMAENQRILLSITCDFDNVEEAGRDILASQKMRSLTIRLAAANPELRPHLLRLLKP